MSTVTCPNLKVTCRKTNDGSLANSTDLSNVVVGHGYCYGRGECDGALQASDVRTPIVGAGHF